MKFNKVYDNLKSIIKENWKILLLWTIIILITFVKLPYQVDMPGNTLNLNDRVTINGKNIDISGSYNLVSVSSVDGSIPYILIGLINPNWEVTKTSDYVADNETMKDYYERNRIYLEQSNSVAEKVALEKAGIEYTIDKEYHTVIYITEEANTDLKLKDEIISIGELKDLNSDSIREYINSHNAGDEITILVNRGGKEKECKAIVYEEDDNRYIGVTIAEYYDISSEYDIEITSGKKESGPSGGMMTTLMIYSGLTNTDLTHGKKIVGTGTIKQDGSVGAIGGIPFKIMGAVKNKADIFLVPEENYEEAINFVKKKKYDIILVSVANLDDAINYLEGLDE